MSSVAFMVSFLGANKLKHSYKFRNCNRLCGKMGKKSSLGKQMELKNKMKKGKLDKLYEFLFYYLLLLYPLWILMAVIIGNIIKHGFN